MQMKVSLMTNVNHNTNLCQLKYLAAIIRTGNDHQTEIDFDLKRSLT